MKQRMHHFYTAFILLQFPWRNKLQSCSSCGKQDERDIVLEGTYSRESLTVEWSSLLSSSRSKFATIDPPSIQSTRKVWPVFYLLHDNFRKSPVVLNGILDAVQEICLSGLMYFMPYEPLCAPKKNLFWQPLCATNHHVWVNAAVANSTNYPVVASLVSCLYGRIMCYSKRETSARNTTCNWLMAICVVE
jgi:hypothetical protein